MPKLAYSKNSSTQERQHATHVIVGGAGEGVNTPITSWPHTLASHIIIGTGEAFNLPGGRVTVMASASDNGGTFTSASINIEVSNDNVTWLLAGTLALTITGTNDGFVIDAPWAYIRSDMTAFTESGLTPAATVTLNI